MRILVALLLAILLVVGGVAWYFYSSLDSIVASLIELHGSRATGTAVTVGSVELDLTGGRAVIRDLTVANPPGFEAKTAFTLGLVSVELDLASTGRQLVAITDVVVDAPVVTFEMNAERESNLQQIYAHLRGEEKEAEEGGPQDPAVPPDLRIDRFTFERGQILVDAERAGGPNRTLDLAPLTLTDLGAPDGAPPAEVGREVVGALIRESSRSLARSGLEDFIDRNVGGETGKRVKEILRGILN